MRVTNDDDLRVGCICKFPWMAAVRITCLTETSVEYEVLDDNGFKRRGVIPRKGFTKRPGVVVLPNARFWAWERDGWVKITLKPGQTLSYGGGGLTDEGHSWFHQEYEYDESWPCVFSRHSNGGSDCDGPYEHHSEAACLLANLSAVPPRIADPEYQLEEIPFARPDWQQGLRSQRDHYAEAAGY